MNCRGLVLMSGGLDSQLAVKVLERAGASVEAVMFTSPFFKDDGTAARAAAALGVKLRKIDFTEDILALVLAPPHGFGGAVNPCIDCHARMIERAGALMDDLGYDFVATGEVQGQRPMSQNRQSLGIVEKCSTMKGRLVRPLSAKLLEPTVPELEGKLDREKLLDFSGRGRERQIALAAELGITGYPAPAGGCRLTEEAFGRKLTDLLDHELSQVRDRARSGDAEGRPGAVRLSAEERLLLELLTVGRRFRLPGGSSVILGRDARENALLEALKGGLALKDGTRPGPVAYIPVLAAEGDRALAGALVSAYCRGTTESDRAPFKPFQIM